MAGIKSESPAGFILECMAGCIGIRNIRPVYRITRLFIQLIGLQSSHTLKLNVGANIASSVDAVGQVVGSQVSETLFPLRVLTFDDLSALTINQGGLSVSVGQKYTLMELGRDLIDPDTKESLGRREVELGLVEITRVDNNLSYAKLVTGKITKSASMILRSASADKAPAIAPSANPGTRSKAFD